jgi:hypothetical protein
MVLCAQVAIFFDQRFHFFLLENMLLAHSMG